MVDRLAHIRRNVVGADATFDGPFGEKAMIYADWTASGRALTSIENYVRAEVLPLYANTHTTTSTCGLQSTCFRQEARQLIAQACNARVGYSDKHADVVVFAGSGSTAAINKLALVLGLHLPIANATDPNSQPVVIVGPHEHHSNILPWRDSCALVVQIPEASDGNIDQQALRSTLEKYKSHNLVIGSFSAASNVTGVVADVDSITELLHCYGALSFWDYAAAAPYLNVDMNPVRFLSDGSVNPHVYKDAVFISPHKLPGGPGAPGVLVAKKRLFSNAVPSEPGGGTVFFVTDSDQRYLSNRHEREEGGTQDIVGSIRAGLAFQTKTEVGQGNIETAEARLFRKVYESLSSNENIAVLGPHASFDDDTDSSKDSTRLPIVSFLVRAPCHDESNSSRFLHHSFVCAVLNDVFGVQVRGGCACAGPYAMSLLGLDSKSQHALEQMLLDQSEVMRPGFSRVSLPYFASDKEVEYTLSAIHAVANHGWRLLTLYRLDSKTGEWRHKTRMRSFPERKWLAHMKLEEQGSSITSGTSAYSPVSPERELERETRFETQLATGLEILEQCGQMSSSTSTKNGNNNNQLLRVPEINELELTNEFEMLTTGTRDDDTEEGRLAYDGETTDETKTKSQQRGMKLDARVANQVRWFMFPSEGAALLRKVLPESTPRALPKTGPHLPLSVLPKPGRLAGVIRPARFDDTKGATNPHTAPHPTGLEHIVDDSHTDSGSFRTISNKYPLRVNSTSSTGNLKTGGLAQQKNNANQVQKVEKTENEKANVTREADVPLTETLTDISKQVVETLVSKQYGSVTLDLTKHNKFAVPPPKLMRVVAKAVSEWQMIVPGDRVMLGLSGGKDSLAMLHILKALQKRYPPGTFHLAACTIDPGTEAFNPRPLIQYCEKLGVEYYYQEENIMAMASEHMSGDSICAFCARMKRGALYSTMRRHGYNKLVLAQHLDDVVESFLMSTMHNGLIRTMKAAYVVDEGDLTVIRPGIYCRERSLRDFSYAAGLPVINENCPACFEAPKERHHIKKLLAREEGIFPSLYSCLKRALTPLLDPAATDLLAAIQRSVEQSSKVGRQKVRQRLASKAGESCKGVESDVENDEKIQFDPELKIIDASEQELLAELVRRRQRGRKVIDEKINIVKVPEGGGSPTSVVDTANTLGDSELRKDMDELNKFCIAEGCVRVV